MEEKPNLLRTAFGAFLLQEDAYAGMRDDAPGTAGAQRMKRAFILVVAVGLLVGVTGACGRVGEWAMSPNMDKMQAIVLGHLQNMPWYPEMSGNPGALEQFDRFYALGWLIAKAMTPSPTALVNIMTAPLSVLFTWLMYGVLAHLAARLLGGKGSASQTLSCTALAVAPQLLNVVMVVPFATAAGVGTWTLICNFWAIRSAHGLTGWRALVATLLPLALVMLLVALFAGCLGVLAGPLLARVGGAR